MGKPFVADPSLTHLFGRVPQHDVRSERFLMRTVLAAAPPDLPKRRTIRRGPILNQAVHPPESPCDGTNHGHCVGYTGRAWLNAEPMRTLRSGPSPIASWWGAQEHDQWEGQHPAWGTSALGLMKYYRTLGLVESYHWAWTVDEIRAWILGGFGGVLLGCDWDWSMMEPDTEGIIRPNGRPAGGHETFLIGADDRKGWVVGQNSWGTNWSVLGGLYRLPYEGLHELLRRDGDAVAAVQRRAP